MYLSSFVVYLTIISGVIIIVCGITDDNTNRCVVDKAHPIIYLDSENGTNAPDCGSTPQLACRSLTYALYSPTFANYTVLQLILNEGIYRSFDSYHNYSSTTDKLYNKNVIISACSNCTNVTIDCSIVPSNLSTSTPAFVFGSGEIYKDGTRYNTKEEVEDINKQYDSVSPPSICVSGITFANYNITINDVDMFGGVIRATNIDRINVLNCTFNNNRVNANFILYSSNSSHVKGASLYVSGFNSVIIYNSYFSENSITYSVFPKIDLCAPNNYASYIQGAAVYVQQVSSYYDTTSLVLISDSSWVENTINNVLYEGESNYFTTEGWASGAGVSIDFNGQTTSVVTVQNSTFNGNVAYEGGAASISEGGSVNIIDNCRFINNEASGIPTSESITGGALLLLPGCTTLIKLEESYFHNNTAHAQGSDSITCNTPNLPAVGGAVAICPQPILCDHTLPIEISNCHFENNIVDGSGLSQTQGGGLYAGYPTSDITISESYFIGNRLNNSASMHTAGAGMYVELGRSKVVGTISMNECHLHDNVILASMITESAPPVSGFSAWGAGAYILLHDGSLDRISYSIHITSCTFENNHANGGDSESGGGGSAYGGGLCVHQDGNSREGTAVLRDCKFQGNVAKAGAGQLWPSPTQAYGGGMYSEVSFTEILSVNFSNNQAVGTGVSSGSTQVTGKSAGGAFAFSYCLAGGPQSIISSCTFFQNSAVEGYTLNGGQLAESFGGAVYNSRCFPVVINNGSTFTQNWAEGQECYGGALFTEGTASVTNTTFEQNYILGAWGHGGAVYAIGDLLSNLSYYEHNSIKSSVGSHGGAAYVNGFVSSTYDTLINNTLTSTGQAYGGGMYIMISGATNISVIANAEISSNLVESNDSRGGGIYLAENATTNPQLINCTLSYNVVNGTGLVGQGGSFYFGSGISIFNTTSASNTADFGGSASFTEQSWGEVEFHSVTMEDNHANGGGGAIFIVSTTSPDTLYCSNSSSLLLTGNSVPYGTYGPTCATNVTTISFISFPNASQVDGNVYIWPSHRFAIKMKIVDSFGNAVLRKDTGIITTTQNNNVSWTLTGIVFTANDSGIFNLDGELYGLPRAGAIDRVSMLTFNTQTLGSKSTIPVNVQTLSHELHATVCPPLYNRSGGTELRCTPCDYGYYNLNSSPACIPCTTLQPPRGNETCMYYTSYYNITFGVGYWPEPSINPVDIKLCKYQDACLPRECFIYKSNTTEFSWGMNCNRSYSERCDVGYGERLCSKCSCDQNATCYYQNYDYSCSQCESTSIYLLLSICAALVLAFILFLNCYTPIIFLEVIVLVVMVVVVLATEQHHGFSLFTDLIIVTVVAYTSTRRAVSSALIASFVFYLQSTSLIINSAVWRGKIEQAVQKQLHTINFRISGLECISAPLFGSALGQTLFLVLFPLALCVLVAASILINKSLTLLIRWIKSKCNLGQRKYRYRRLDAVTNNTEPKEDDEEDAKLTAGEDYIINNSASAADSVSNEQSAMFSDSEIVFIEHNNPTTNNNNNTLSNTGRRLSAKIVSSSLFLLYYSQFYVQTKLLALFPCDDHNRYLDKYPYIPCDYSNQEFKLLRITAYFFTFFYGFILSAVWVSLLLWLWRSIHKGEASAARWFGFFYGSFQPKYKYWSLVWLVRKLVLACLLALVPEGSYQVLPIMLVLTVSVLAHLAAFPAQDPRDNKAEVIASGVLLATYVASTVVPFNGSGNENHLGLRIVLLVMNGAVVLMFCYLLVLPYYRKTYLSLKRKWRRKSMLK